MSSGIPRSGPIDIELSGISDDEIQDLPPIPPISNRKAAGPSLNTSRMKGLVESGKIGGTQQRYSSDVSNELDSKRLSMRSETQEPSPTTNHATTRIGAELIKAEKKLRLVMNALQSKDNANTNAVLPDEDIIATLQDTLHSLKILRFDQTLKEYEDSHLNLSRATSELSTGSATSFGFVRGGSSSRIGPSPRHRKKWKSKARQTLNPSSSARPAAMGRRRFTLGGGEVDQRGLEIAKWLAGSYSTLRRAGDRVDENHPIGSARKHMQEAARSTHASAPASPITRPSERVPIDASAPNLYLFATAVHADSNGHNPDSDEESGDTSPNNFGPEHLQVKRKHGQNRRSTHTRTRTEVDKKLAVAMSTEGRVRAVLDGIGEWNWCIFDLEGVAPKQYLLLVANHIFHKLNLFQKFSIEYEKFLNFFSVVQRGYKENPYHCGLHGADVLVNMYYWIVSDDDYASYLSDIDILIALTAAACHDYGHPGTTQNFHIQTNSPLALRYNGRSVLENMHCSETMRLLLKPENAIFANIPKDEFRYVRETIVDMILGTDMQKHGAHVEAARHMAKRRAEAAVGETRDSSSLELDRAHCLTIGLHVSDIGNPTKTWEDCKQWTDRLMEEWYRQGDKEKNMGIPVSPMMDRDQPNVPRGQIGFIDYIVFPLFDAWGQVFSSTDICLQNLRSNKARWEQILVTEQAAKEAALAKANSSLPLPPTVPESKELVEPDDNEFHEIEHSLSRDDRDSESFGSRSRGNSETDEKRMSMGQLNDLPLENSDSNTSSIVSTPQDRSRANSLLSVLSEIPFTDAEVMALSAIDEQHGVGDSNILMEEIERSVSPPAR